MKMRHGNHVSRSFILLLFALSGFKSLPNCVTKECIDVAAHLLNFMNPNADPCDDFYEAACGRYLQHHHFDDSPPMFGFKNIRKKMDSIVMKGLIKEFENSNDQSEKYVASFYKSCTTNKVDEKIWKSFMYDDIGDLPKELPEDLSDLLGIMARRLGTTGYFDVGVRMIGEERKLYLELSPPNLDDYDLEKVFNDLKRLGVNSMLIDSIKNSGILERVKELAREMASDESFSYDMQSGIIDWKIFFNHLGVDVKNKVVFKSVKYFQRLEAFRNYKEYIFSIPLCYWYHRMESDVNKMQKDCDQAVIDNFPGVIGMYYIRKFFKEDNLNTSTSLANSILDSMKTVIEQSKFSITSKSHYTRKMNLVKLSIGYPKEQEHINYSWNSDENFVNLVYNLKYNQTVSMLEYVKNNKQPLFYQPIHLAETSYSSSMNVLTVSSLIMQSPFMDSLYPKQYNFASFGSIVASELAKIAIWDVLIDSDLKRHPRVDCFFKSHRFMMSHYQWILSKNPAIDTMMSEQLGFLIAYHAYKASEEEPKVRIPGTDHLTPDQIFFYRYAQRSCAPTPSEHSDDDDRLDFPEGIVNAILMNSDEFSTAFNCRKRTKMNPAEKCPSF